MKGFLLTMSGVVLTKWIDQNGHMNVSSYMNLFDQSTNILLQQSGLVSLEIDSEITLVAGRIFIEHRKELLEGESWEVWSGFVTVCSSFITITHRIRSGTSIRAVCDIRGTAFSKFTRKSAFWDIDSMMKAKRFLVPGLADRFEKNSSNSNQIFRGLEQSQSSISNRWQIVIFTVNGKPNHVGISIPNYGLADLSLLGARIISWDGSSLPKGERLFFDIEIPTPEDALAFLQQPGLLTLEIIKQEKKFKGWHLTEEAPDFVRRLRNLRSRNPSDMNCVEWIVYALELGGINIPMDVLTPTELMNWCQSNYCVILKN
ncbi:acyl-CoA thioesterase [Leptospira noguchii]|uniref:Thioesterase-like family protein n=1 Tax=Leptospira noguchii serovar Panama str. CZ214 TaxID=1001595 RepID=T0FHC9_9LEPT|nr:thioesterase family protein [Leptospira noguchii]EQA69459.1 hypothetical protein LEP1GSC059_1881 [Leptospira noguchii serovar Panama str. CZ214]